MRRDPNLENPPILSKDVAGLVFRMFGNKHWEEAIRPIQYSSRESDAALRVTYIHIYIYIYLYLYLSI